MSEDGRVTAIILSRLENIERKLDEMQSRGCSKADGHTRAQAATQEAVTELFRRTNALELAQAEGRGKLAVMVSLVTAAVGLFFTWLGKRL